MRFDYIDITNYRQYRKMHIDFPRNVAHDLHIVLGSNGMGKSNLLNAVNWCLYGDEPHLTDNTKALCICNLSSLEDARTVGHSSVSVVVIIKASNANEEYIIERRCEVTTNEQARKSTLLVKYRNVNGSAVDLTGDKASDIIMQIIPQTIREYFFFDGEQLHTYFEKTKKKAHVKDSILNVAQVNVVQSAKNHVASVSKEYRTKLTKDCPELQSLQDAIDKKQEAIATMENDMEALQESISNAKARISQLTSNIAGSDKITEAHRHYEANLQRLESLEEDKKSVMQELFKLYRTYYIMVMLHDVNESTAQYIDNKSDSNTLMPDVNIEILKKTVASGRCCLCHTVLPKDMLAKYQMIIDQFDVSPEASRRMISIQNDVHRFCDEAERYASVRDGIFSRYRKINEEIAELQASNAELQVLLSKCSIVDEIERWVDERNDLMSSYETNTAKLGGYEVQLRHLQSELSQLTVERDNALDKMKDVESVKDALAISMRAEIILSDIVDEITEDLRENMEAKTFEYFDKLIWKEHTYKSIRLDDDFNVDLIHKDTGKSCMGSTSAAECEMLALAFTLALHAVSGHKNLLFIDTPVGRVSDDNRKNFAKGLLTVAAHKQLILVFTPSEFSEEIREYFTDDTVASCHEMYSRDEKETNIRKVRVKDV